MVLVSVCPCNCAYLTTLFGAYSDRGWSEEVPRARPVEEDTINPSEEVLLPVGMGMARPIWLMLSMKTNSSLPTYDFTFQH